jgi:hypothetical protein
MTAGNVLVLPFLGLLAASWVMRRFWRCIAYHAA